MNHPIAFRRNALFAALALSMPFGAQSQLIGVLQGSAHLSTFADTRVDNIAGIVTAVDNNGFWMQDGGDANPLTSDAIYVFRHSSGSKPVVGQAVTVTGQLEEFRPGGSATNLTTTQINARTSNFAFGNWTSVSLGNALPAATVLGAGFLPPSAIAPNVGNVETAPGYTLQPSQYAIDFYESLEGMRVSIPSAVSVGPRNSFFEVPVIASAQVGAPGTITAPRGGVVVGPGQFNGHRVLLDDRLMFRSTPNVHSGAQLSGIVGILDYGFSNYKLNITQAVTVDSNALMRETASIAPGRLGIASYNVENLGGNASAERFTTIAGQIKNTLGAPHLIALQEVQDDNGTGTGTVSSDETLSKLVTELNLQTGKNYQFVVVNPVDGADGGQPNGNIRQAFLYDTAHVSFPGGFGGALDAMSATAGPGGQIQLNLGAGRIDPTNPAFANSRKPLVAEFTVDGQQFIVITNHFNSKGGDQPLFGPSQSPVLSSATQRLGQATAVGSFVADLLGINPNANIIVAGDLNDFQFADTLQPLLAAGLFNMTDQLAAGERYTYNFEGNLQALDHMFVSPNLMNNGNLAYDIVHANAEFSDQLSDHDPTLLTFALAPVPEPETFAMLLAGLVLVGGLTRRRRAGRATA